MALISVRLLISFTNRAKHYKYISPHFLDGFFKKFDHLKKFQIFFGFQEY